MSLYSITDKLVTMMHVALVSLQRIITDVYVVSLHDCIASYPGLPMFFNDFSRAYVEKHGKAWVRGYDCTQE